MKPNNEPHVLLYPNTVDHVWDVLGDVRGSRSPSGLKEAKSYARLVTSATLAFRNVEVFKPRYDRVLKINPKIRMILSAVRGLESPSSEDESYFHGIDFGDFSAVTDAYYDKILDGMLEAFSEQTIIRYGLDDLEKYRSALKIFYEDCTPYFRIATKIIKSSTVILSPDFDINELTLRGPRTLTPSSILAILATSGIEIVLPSVDVSDVSVIDEIKAKHANEREELLDFLSRFIQQCYEGVKSGDYADVWEFASYTSTQELVRKVAAFERGLARSDARLKRSIKVGFLDEVPEIFSSYAFGTHEDRMKAGVKILSLLCKSWGDRATYKRLKTEYPEAAYLYEVRKKLGSGNGGKN